jgi:FkbM family methyltransferase
LLHGTAINGLPVLTPAELSERHSGDAILVASTLHDSAISKSLAARGCRNVVPVGYLNRRLPAAFGVREYDGAAAAAWHSPNRVQIEAAFALCGDEQSRRVFLGKLEFYLGLDKRQIEAIRSEEPIYFDDTVVNLRADEVVADAGAFTGDTLHAFEHASAGTYAGYVAFEPDPGNFQVLSDATRLNPRIRVVHAAVASSTGKVAFLNSDAADSRLRCEGEQGGISVPAVSLDQHFETATPPTLIKMDIEGAEADALAGAATLIARHSPVLAVSAYHYPSDLWTIPLLLHRLAPDSEILLRHYTHEIDDTVCYAVPPARVLTDHAIPST